MSRTYTHRDLTGLRFGRWVVLRENERKTVKQGNKPPRKLIAWWCRCDCGTERPVLSGELVNKNSQSCGCWAEEKRIQAISRPTEQVLSTLQHGSYKSAAKARGISWKLNKRKVASLIFNPCIYCGTPPSSIKTNSQGKTIGFASGIDRIDSSLGYEEGNVVPCCGPCNRAKGTSSHAEFTAWLDRLIAFRSQESK
jgi:hypothetical protein